MVAKYEPCSICEEYIEGVACTKDQCPVAKMKAEIERLEAYNANLEAANSHITNTLWDEVVKAKTEAIKEFAERLKESISNMEYTANIKRKTVSVETLYTQVNWVFHEIVPKTIDKLVEEMTEGEDGNL